jgi:microcystin-dependent protein
MGLWSDWYEKNAGKEERAVNAEFVLKKIDEALSASKVCPFPIGYIYMSASSANPSTLYPGTTWAAWGSGRVPVGVDTSQTEFNSVEKTGGEKAHTLTVDEMPSHNHSLDSLSGNISTTTDLTGTIEFLAMKVSDETEGGNGIISSVHNGNADLGGVDLSYGKYRKTTINANHTHSLYNLSGTVNSSGNNTAHNNLQPYITCYIWKRTA